MNEQCRACGHTAEEHTGKPGVAAKLCVQTLNEKPSCQACLAILTELYSKQPPPMTITVSQSDREWFKEVDAAYLQRQYDALHIRRS